jgi:hypothetical protein
MAISLTWELTTGNQDNLDPENPTRILKFRGRNYLPINTGGMDFFDYASFHAWAFVNGNYPTQQTPLGLLYLNSVQIHENFYGINYDLTANYSRIERATGTFQITVDQAVGTVKMTAGRRIAGYGDAADEVDNEGVFFNGTEVTGVEEPVAEDKIIISYRHPEVFLNHNYIRAVGSLRGYPNNDLFLGYQPGEVKYMGGQFTESEAEATAQYHFAISRRAVDLPLGEITIDVKEGWDSISPTYEAEVHEAGGGSKHGIRKLKYVEIIRTREWKDYVSVFGWGNQ